MLHFVTCRQEHTVKAYTIETVLALLTQHGISTATWGTGNAKTLAHLVDELNAGESTLEPSGSIIVRKTAALFIHVHHDGSHLKETKQVFRDGRERVRDIAGLGEKLKPGEDPLTAMRRALEEELGIDPEFVTVTSDIETAERPPEESRSYPGLLSAYTTHTLRVEIDPSQYNPDGYTETQDDKTTYFEWVEV